MFPYQSRLVSPWVKCLLVSVQDHSDSSPKRSRASHPIDGVDEVISSRAVRPNAWQVRSSGEPDCRTVRTPYTGLTPRPAMVRAPPSLCSTDTKRPEDPCSRLAFDVRRHVYTTMPDTAEPSRARPPPGSVRVHYNPRLGPSVACLQRLRGFDSERIRGARHACLSTST